jgi:beta-N-acetylhexosaminidase
MALVKKNPPQGGRREPGCGRLLVIGFDGTAMSPQIADLLTRIQPGGVILFARNIVNAQQTHRLLRDCQACVREPLFAMVDLEGGRVDRFRNVTGPAPSAAEVFATGNGKLYRKHGQLIGKACCAMGFNTDLAPVLDLAFEASRAVMSSRAFSIQPKDVIVYAREFLAGLRSAGVTGSGKHFPGLGQGNLDSHHDLPVIKKGFNALWDEDLVPYRVMKRELPMVLVNHANYPAVTRDRLPASLSQYWIREVLRKKIGYRGLIVSDDLEMGGVLKAAPVEEAAMEFVRAGGDLCLICREPGGIERAFAKMAKECERDARFRRRVTESVKRVQLFKRKHARFLRIGSAPSEEKIARLSRQLWEFSEQVRYSAMPGATAAGAGR